jgi:hypothetical protein
MDSLQVWRKPETLGVGDIVHYDPALRQSHESADTRETRVRWAIPTGGDVMPVRKYAESNIVALQPHRRRGDRKAPARGGLSDAQRAFLARGLEQPGGKLPLFDRDGQKIPARTIRSCIKQGLAEPWFENPIKPDWLVCRLTDKGRLALGEIEKR